MRTSGRINWNTGGGLAAIGLWSTTFAVARSLTEQVGALWAGAAVYLVGGLLCGARLAWTGAKPLHLLQLPRKYLLGCGGLFLFYTAAIYLAVGLAKDREQMLEIALLNYLWPAATILLSLPLLKLRAGPALIPGNLAALAGVFLVMTQNTALDWNSFLTHVRSNPLAYALALAAALSWGCYSTLTRRWSKPGGAGAVELFIPATGLVLLGFSLAAGETVRWNLRAVAESCFLGSVTALAYVLWDQAMRRGNLLLVAIGSYFTPVLSTLVSCAYLGLAPGPQLWLGCLLISVGSLITWRSVRETNP